MTEPRVTTYGGRPYDDHPPFRYPDYRSTVKRAPQKNLVKIVQTLSETTGPGPVSSEVTEVTEADADLTTNAGTGEAAIGQRIIVTGRLLDEDGQGLPGMLIELWQANASGRYAHWRETEFPAPMDPNFLGVGQCKTDADGAYRFQTVKPGPYPWGNHENAWRPAHIHFSILGPNLGSRLVTQMYFPGDPLQPLDPIFLAVPEHARDRLIATYDHDVTEDHWATGYRWDIVVRGKLATPFDGDGEAGR